MRVTSGERLLKGVRELLTGESKLPSGTDFPVIRGHLDLALGQAWRSEWWGDLMRREPRFFRPNWSSLTTYGAAAEVYDPFTQKYYQSLRAANLNNAPTLLSGSTYVENSAWWAVSNPTYPGPLWVTGTAYAVGDKRQYANTSRIYQCYTAHTSSAVLTPDATGGNARWGLLTPFARTIDKDAAGQTALGDVFDVKDSDNRMSTQALSLDWDDVENEIWVSNAVPFVWVEFRTMRPLLTGSAYDSTLGYTAGQQVYWDDGGALTGNFYDCVADAAAGADPTSSPANWAVTQIPRLFEGYLIWSAYSKTLVGDEQDDRKVMAEETANGFLETETDNIYRQQGKTPSLSPRTY